MCPDARPAVLAPSGRRHPAVRRLSCHVLTTVRTRDNPTAVNLVAGQRAAVQALPNGFLTQAQAGRDVAKFEVSVHGVRMPSGRLAGQNLFHVRILGTEKPATRSGRWSTNQGDGQKVGRKASITAKP